MDFQVDHLQDGCKMLTKSLPSNPDEISQRNPENSHFCSSNVLHLERGATRNKPKKNTTQQEKQDESKRKCNPEANVSANASKLTEATTQTMSGDESVHLEVILQELRGFRQDNREQLEEIKEETVKTNTRLDKAQSTNKLDEKITDQESRSRWDNVRIYGIPEGTEKEALSMISFVEKSLRENLDIPAKC